MQTTLLSTLLKNCPKTDARSKLEQHLEDVNALIRASIISNQDFSVSIYNSIHQIFLLRIEAVLYFKEHKIDIFEVLNEVSDNLNTQIQSIADQSNENVNVLVENSLFAFRSLRKIALKSREAVILKPLENIDGQHCISYENFRHYLKSTYDNFGKNTQKNIVNFFDASLMLEACLIAVHLIAEEELISKLSDEKVNDLSEIIVGNAQTYGACAMSLGIVGNKKHILSYDAILEQEDLVEQMLVAESGINEYRQMIDNE